ncbi:MAG TPA: glycosyltransferase [Blastocatellia bacterium]|nr:glycosyltransferase [Blastocatellia bacterium]
MRLAWNAIVRNESACIRRCVRSLLPHIDAGIVVDTGSTDGTPGLIFDLFDEAKKPLELYSVPFVNFEQARNEALRRARDSKLAWDYLLLVDADMEFVTEDPNWFTNGGGLSYDMRQTAGGVSYFNRRLLSRQATGNYVGVTHEYLDVPTSGSVNGCYFIDHADGSNRPEKFKRDIELLRHALKTESRIGLVQRYAFYLAQSYFDSGDWERAAKWYKKRVELGGWDEEVWNARLHYAHALENMGKKPEFLWEMLQAYGMRPSRAEVLYDLAKYFRERGQNHVSLLFSETGAQIPPSSDQLFVNDYAYHTGCKEEFAICAFYDPARRERGAAISNRLALDRRGTPQSREQARANLYWYLQPLSELVASFRTTRLLFPDYDGYVPMNPSVINYNGKPLVLVRTVNYTITEGGEYAIRSPDGSDSGNRYPIDTRNYLVALASDGVVERVTDIALPTNLPEPQYQLVRGFEDSRLFEWRGELWSLSTVRELNPEGWCEQVIAPIVFEQRTASYGNSWRAILPKQRANEKNWSPFVLGDELRFVYRLGTLVDLKGEIVEFHPPSVDIGHISGGSQVISVGNDQNLCIVHEARSIPGSGLRFYSHRFARLAADGRLAGLSRPFFFAGRQIEFAAGMALFGDKLMVSYGLKDQEAWLATMDVGEVLALTYS